MPELDESFKFRLHNVSESNQKLQPGSVSIYIILLQCSKRNL